MSPRHHATRVLEHARKLIRAGTARDEAFAQALDTVPEAWRELVKAHLRSIKARRGRA